MFESLIDSVVADGFRRGGGRVRQQARVDGGGRDLVN